MPDGAIWPAPSVVGGCSDGKVPTGGAERITAALRGKRKNVSIISDVAFRGRRIPQRVEPIADPEAARQRQSTPL
jgi:hypothetical protein